jgi:nucleotide-binding universal stress UspA family protein
MSNSTSSILVPIDSTEKSALALNQACSIATHTHAKIVLLAIEEQDNQVTLQRRLARIALEVSERTSCPVEIIIRQGDVDEEIQKVADVLNSLLVLVFPSKRTLSKLLGKNPFSFVGEFKHPIIVIRGSLFEENHRTILLPLQLRKETREKVDRAIELAKQYKASIRIASILTQKDDENALLAHAHQVWKSVKAHDIRCTLKTLRGKNPVQMILDYGHLVNADIILIMNKEAINLKEFFTGTVAQHLMNESDIPIMCYQPMKRKNKAVFTPY